MYVDHQYINLLRDLFAKAQAGGVTPDRTGTGRIKFFSKDMEFDLKKGFPMDTTRKIYFKTMVKELLAFTRGRFDLAALGPIWTKWSPTGDDVRAQLAKIISKEDLEAVGEERALQMTGLLNVAETIGPLYGYCWRHAPAGHRPEYAPVRKFEDLPKDKVAVMRIGFEQAKIGNPHVTEEAFQMAAVRSYHESYDQFHECFLTLRDDPYSSRAYVSTSVTNFLPFPGVKPKENVMMGRGALAPCHIYFQFLVEDDELEPGKKKLNCQLVMRSNDLPVGNPYNVGQYAILTHMFAQCLGMNVGMLAVKMVDCHIYADQLEGLALQTTREPFAFPILKINPEVTSLYDFQDSDFTLEGYQHHPDIKYPVAE